MVLLDNLIRDISKKENKVKIIVNVLVSSKYHWSLKSPPSNY